MASNNPRPRAKEKACDQAIKETLTYSAIFDFPLSRFQIYTFLISKRKFDEDFFEKSIKRLVKKGHIKAKDGKYYLPGVRPVSWNLRTKYSNDLLEENKTAIELLKKVPWIKMLAVTGSVATYGAGKDDDVDMFIVTRKERVWLTRGFVSLILLVTNRFAHDIHHDRKICCNLYIDETKLKWPEDKHNIFIAHEIAKMQPILDKDETYFNFLRSNEWIRDHFKNFKITLPKTKRPPVKGSKLVNLLEKLAYNMQIKYMEKKKTTEVTKKDTIHFNKTDHMNRILESYKETLDRYCE